MLAAPVHGDSVPVLGELISSSQMLADRYDDIRQLSRAELWKLKMLVDAKLESIARTRSSIISVQFALTGEVITVPASTGDSVASVCKRIARAQGVQEEISQVRLLACSSSDTIPKLMSGTQFLTESIHDIRAVVTPRARLYGARACTTWAATNAWAANHWRVDVRGMTCQVLPFSDAVSESLRTQVARLQEHIQGVHIASATGFYAGCPVVIPATHAEPDLMTTLAVAFGVTEQHMADFRLIRWDSHELWAGFTHGAQARLSLAEEQLRAFGELYCANFHCSDDFAASLRLAHNLDTGEVLGILVGKLCFNPRRVVGLNGAIVELPAHYGRVSSSLARRLRVMKSDGIL